MYRRAQPSTNSAFYTLHHCCAFPCCFVAICSLFRVDFGCATFFEIFIFRSIVTLFATAPCSVCDCCAYPCCFVAICSLFRVDFGCATFFEIFIFSVDFHTIRYSTLQCLWLLCISLLFCCDLLTFLALFVCATIFRKIYFYLNLFSRREEGKNGCLVACHLQRLNFFLIIA